MTPRAPLLGHMAVADRGHLVLVLWASAMTGANVVLLFIAFRGALIPEQAKGTGSVSSQCSAESVCSQSAFEVSGQNSSWYQMKAFPPPAQCRVQGFVIEDLEPQLNFRRAWALGYANTPEDKTHLFPFFRALQDRSMATRKRRVLLALGAQKWENILWFLRYYPLDFTEVHVWEEKKGQFKKPSNSGTVHPKLIDSINAQSQVEGAGNLPVPDWMLDRVRLYYGFVRTDDVDPGETSIRSVNITKVIEKNLKLTKDDAVVCLMDIEHAEWEVLPVWMQTESMAEIIDELFLEVHYKHPSMEYFQWTKGKSREDAERLYLQLRFKGFFVHPWP